MDTEQNTAIAIDISQCSVDGHGDYFMHNMASSAMESYDLLTSNVTYPTGPALTISTPFSNTYPNVSPSWTFSDLSITSPPSGRLQLQGDDADIEINGESVVSMLREIRDRLNILQVSEEMEQEWDDLRELREQYEAKLAECREKSKIWQALKS